MAQLIFGIKPELTGIAILGSRGNRVEERGLMDVAGAEKIPYLELVKRVIETHRKAMTAGEIWEAAQESGLAKLLNATGKKAEGALAGILYRDVRKPNSQFQTVGASPARFLLKSLVGSIPEADLKAQIAAEPQVEPEPKYNERDLHPLFVWFASSEFAARCKTIHQEKAKKKGEKQNQWTYPDIVGFALNPRGWKDEVVKLVKATGAPAVRLYSFELKKSLYFSNLREAFFQAVSNSSWAHEGYLAAVDIDWESPEFERELRRLSQSHGIGIVQMDTSEPENCRVLIPARGKEEIDWETLNALALLSEEFEQFVASVNNSLLINKPEVSDFDKVLDEVALGEYLRRKLNQ